MSGWFGICSPAEPALGKGRQKVLPHLCLWPWFFATGGDSCPRPNPGAEQSFRVLQSHGTFFGLVDGWRGRYVPRQGLVERQQLILVADSCPGQALRGGPGVVCGSGWSRAKQWSHAAGMLVLAAAQAPSSGTGGWVWRSRKPSISGPATEASPYSCAICSQSGGNLLWQRGDFVPATSLFH